MQHHPNAGIRRAAFARNEPADRVLSADITPDKVNLNLRGKHLPGLTAPDAPKHPANNQHQAQAEFSPASQATLQPGTCDLLNSNFTPLQSMPCDFPFSPRLQGFPHTQGTHMRHSQSSIWSSNSPQLHCNTTASTTVQRLPQQLLELPILTKDSYKLYRGVKSNSTETHPLLADIYNTDPTPGEYSDHQSIASIGVRSSLVDTNSWYLQQKRRKGGSRVQSIAATGRDSYYYTNALSTSRYSTANSSMWNGKDGIVDIESATDYSDPIMTPNMANLQKSETMPANISSRPSTIESMRRAAVIETVSTESNSTASQYACDSSVLWMYNAVEEGSMCGGGGSGKQGHDFVRSSTQARVHKPAARQQLPLATAPNAYSSNQPQSHYEKPFNAINANRFMFYSSQTGEIHAPNLQKLAFNRVRLEELATDNDTTRPCFWLDVSQPTERELHKLGEMFDLHPLTLEDIEQKCSRDKIDRFGDYLFIVYHTIAKTKRNKWQHYYSYCRANSSIRPATGDKCFQHNRPLGHIIPETGSEEDILEHSDEEVSQGHAQIFIVMKRNCVLTFHSGAQRKVVSQVVGRLSAMSAVAAQISSSSSDDSSRYCRPADVSEGNIDMSSESDDPLAKLVDYPAYIVYAILDQITDQLSPEITELEQQVDAIDELVLILTHAEHESVLQQMGEQRRRILQTWHLTQPKTEVIALLAKLLSNDSRTTLQGSRSAVLQQMGGSLASEVVQYLGDVHEHLLAGIDACARAETVLARSHSNYLAKISLELSRATYDANSTTERWTMLGMIVVPINILTSFLGVNLKIPGQDRDDTLNFFVVLACMLIYAGVTLAFWRWRRIV
ncbi:CorA metal ion transporter [Coemansia sp. RSA 1365]|nr:CorA metal ion transporter [Coemansia sp. RSA 1365]